MIHTSVVIPIKNEEENIVELIEELEPVMNQLGKPWELICIEDGSTDKSLEVLQTLCATKPYLRVIAFTKNFGQSSAFSAGFEAARGEFIVTLDGDRQNDPRDIPKLMEAIEEPGPKGQWDSSTVKDRGLLPGSPNSALKDRDCGLASVQVVDLVVGWRVNRRDPWKKRIISKVSNKIRGRLCQDDMHDTGCSLKAYRKEALKKIKMYKGMHRFLPALFKIEGFQVVEIPVNHRDRSKGKTKYNFMNRSIGPIIDMFVVRWMRKRALKHTIQAEFNHERIS